MTPLFQQIITYALLPTLALTGGGLLALFIRFGVQARSAILHFAAGVVFSVVAVEILPDVVRLHSPALTAIGFALGIGLMLLIRHLTATPESPETGAVVSVARLPTAFLLAIGVDLFIDGLLLGIGFAAGAKEGVLLAVALAVEVLSLGLATATSLQEKGLSRARIVSLLTGMSALFFWECAGRGHPVA